MIVLGGCATRPVNPPITQADPSTGYRFEVRQAEVKNKDNLVILAFSGGGTRAAAFSYGVLEFLRRTEIIGPKGNTGSLQVRCIAVPQARAYQWRVATAQSPTAWNQVLSSTKANTVLCEGDACDVRARRPESRDLREPCRS